MRRKGYLRLQDPNLLFQKSRVSLYIFNPLCLSLPILRLNYACNLVNEETRVDCRTLWWNPSYAHKGEAFFTDESPVLWLIVGGLKPWLYYLRIWNPPCLQWRAPDHCSALLVVSTSTPSPALPGDFLHRQSEVKFAWLILLWEIFSWLFTLWYSIRHF